MIDIDPLNFASFARLSGLCALTVFAALRFLAKAQTKTEAVLEIGREFDFVP